MVLAGSKNIISYANKDLKDNSLRSSSLSRLWGTAAQVKNLVKPTSATEGEAREEIVHLRKDLIRTFIEAQNTEKLLLQNTSSLKKAASAGDESATAVLEYLKDTKKTQSTQKMLEEKTLSTREATHLIKSLEKFTSALSTMDLDMKVSIPKLVEDYTSLLQKEIDPSYKSTLLKSLTKFLETSEVQSESLTKLTQLSAEGYALEGNQLTEVNKLLGTLSEDVIGREVKTSLNDISESLDTSVLQQEELQEVLDTEVKSLGKSLKDSFTSLPGMFSKGQGLLSGGLHTLFASTGLDILNMIGAPELLAGGGIFRGARGAVGGVRRGGRAVRERFRRPGREEAAPLEALRVPTTPGRGLRRPRRGAPRRRGRRGRGGIGGILGTVATAGAGLLGAGVLTGGITGEGVEDYYPEEEYLSPDIGIPERRERVPRRKAKAPRTRRAGRGIFKKLGKKSITKIGGKTLGKSLLKKLPGIGLLAGAGFGISRLMQGDILGALGEVGSGAASIVPGLGTALSTAIDVGLAARDIKKEGEAELKEPTIPIDEAALEASLVESGIPPMTPDIHIKPQITRQQVVAGPPTREIPVAQPVAPLSPPPQIIQIPVPVAEKQGGVANRKMVIDDYGIALTNSLLFE
jgi:hypothetical protein